MSIVLLAVGLAGIALLEKRLRFVLYGTLVLYLLFDWMYRCGNWFQVILPAYPLILLGAAAALDRWEDYFRQRKSWLREAPLALLILLIVWRFAASYERANSRNQPHDLAFARAGVLLDQPLPAHAGVFAPVEDALALDYLINIWGINPTVQVVSSKQAWELLKDGGAVLSTFDVAPVLLSELPPEVQPARRVLSADWLQLSAEPLAAPDAITQVNQLITPGVTLRGYRVTAAPDGSPATDASPATDITLFWNLENGWPADLGVSIRPVRDGEFIPDPNGAPGAIYQVDRSAPGEGLVPADSPELVTDVIRAPLPPNTDAVRLLIYRRSGDDFESLADLVLPTPQ
ncbi:MAG: hypothetical protein IPK16_25105 [Anaerolineales bacterium]|nr:hypothetical protein [Anaerolineales bacterium]